MSLWGALGSIGGAVLGNMVAPGIGTALGGMLGGSVGGAIDQSNAVGAANGAAQAGNQAALSEQQRQFDLTRSDYAPWRQTGQQALGQYWNELQNPPTADQIMAQDPGYGFGLQQGQQALARQMAAAGGRVSGAAIKAGQQYAQDYATTHYGQAYNRSQDRLNRLAALANVGQTAVSGTTNAGLQTSNAISGLLNNAGQTQAGSYLAGGNIWGNAANQIGAYFARPNYSNPIAGSAGYGLNPLTDAFNSAYYSTPGWNAYDPGMAIPG